MKQTPATARVSICNRKSLPILTMTIFAIFIMLPATAAACGPQSGQTPNLALPWMQGVPSFNTGANLSARSYGTIVGLWHLTYTTSDNQPFGDSFDMWHRDGTELESANLNPITGNLCLGVWEQVGSEIHLHHVGWTFDNFGNLIGPFTLDDIVALGNRGNSYSGSFDLKQYDTNGNLLQEVTGTVSATRIGVN
jgi:hypothetical protein